MPNELTELFRANDPTSTLTDEEITLRFAESNNDRLDALLQQYPRFREEYNNIINEAFPVTFGDRAKQFIGSGVQGITGTLASLPESIGIMAAELERKYPTGMGPTDPSETATGQIADAIKSFGKSISPEVPVDKQARMQDDFFTTKVPGAIGSGVGFVAGGFGTGKVVQLATKKGAEKISKEILEGETKRILEKGKKFAATKTSDSARESAALATRRLATKKGQDLQKKYLDKLATYTQRGTIATLGAAAGASEGYRDAINSGADRDTAFNAFLLNSLVGTTEIVPISRMINRLDNASGGTLKDAIATAGRESIEEAIQEAIQGTAGDAIAKYILEYDQDREMFTDLAEDAGAGAIAGAVLSLFASGVNRKLKNLAGDETADDPEKPLSGLQVANTIYQLDSGRVDEIRALAKSGQSGESLTDPQERVVFNAEVERLQRRDEERKRLDALDEQLKDVVRDDVSPKTLLELSLNMQANDQAPDELVAMLDGILSPRLLKKFDQAMKGERELTDKDVEGLMKFWDDLGLPMQLGVKGDRPSWSFLNEEMGPDDRKNWNTIEGEPEILPEEAPVTSEEPVGPPAFLDVFAAGDQREEMEAEEERQTNLEELKRADQDAYERKRAALLRDGEVLPADVSKIVQEKIQQVRQTTDRAAEGVLERRAEVAPLESDLESVQNKIKEIDELAVPTDAELEGKKPGELRKISDELNKRADKRNKLKEREQELQTQLDTAKAKSPTETITGQDVDVDNSEFVERKNNKVRGGMERPAFSEANDGTESGQLLANSKELSDSELGDVLLSKGTKATSGVTQRLVFVKGEDGVIYGLGVSRDSKSGKIMVTRPGTRLNDKGKVIRRGRTGKSQIPLSEFLGSVNGEVISTLRLNVPRKYPNYRLTQEQYDKVSSDARNALANAKQLVEGVDSKIKSASDITSTDLTDGTGGISEQRLQEEDDTLSDLQEADAIKESQDVEDRLTGEMAKMGVEAEDVVDTSVAPETGVDAQTGDEIVTAEELAAENVTSIADAVPVGEEQPTVAKAAAPADTPKIGKNILLDLFSSIFQFVNDPALSENTMGSRLDKGYNDWLNTHSDKGDEIAAFIKTKVQKAIIQIGQEQNLSPNEIADRINEQDILDRVEEIIADEIETKYKQNENNPEGFSLEFGSESLFKGAASDLLGIERRAAPVERRSLPPRQSDRGVQATYSRVIKVLLAAGINVEQIEGAFADINNRVRAYFEVDTNTGSRLVKIALGNLTQPTHTNLTDLLHEVAHVVGLNLTPETRAKVLKAVSKLSDNQLGIEGSDFLYYDPDNVSDLDVQEERLVESVAKQLVEEGFDPAQTLTFSQIVVRAFKHLLLAAKMMLQRVTGKPMSGEVAREYFRLQVEAFLTGGSVPSFITYAGGFKDTVTDVVRSHTPITSGNIAEYDYDIKNHTIQYDQVVPDNAEAARHDILNASPRSVDKIIRFAPAEREEYTQEELEAQRKRAKEIVAANKRVREVLVTAFTTWMMSGLNKINPKTNKPIFTAKEFEKLLLKTSNPDEAIAAAAELANAPELLETDLSELREEDSKKIAAQLAERLVGKMKSNLKKEGLQSNQELSDDREANPNSAENRRIDAAQDLEVSLENYRNISSIQSIARKVFQELVRVFKPGESSFSTIKSLANKLLKDEKPKARQARVEQALNSFLKNESHIDALSALAKLDINFRSKEAADLASEAIQTSTDPALELLKDPAYLVVALSFAKKRPVALKLLELREDPNAGLVDKVLKVAMIGTPAQALNTMTTLFSENSDRFKKRRGVEQRLTEKTEQLIDLIAEQRKELASLEDEVAEHKAKLEMYETVTTYLDQQQAELQAEYGGEIAYSGTQFELVDGATLMNPSSGGQAVSNIPTKKVDLGSGKTLTFIRELKRIRDAQATWLYSQPVAQRGAEWNSMKRQMDSITKHIADNKHREINNSMIIRVLGSVSDQLDLVGSPYAQKIAEQVRKYSSHVQSYSGSKARTEGRKWAIAMSEAMAAVGMSNALGLPKETTEEFKKNYYNNAMQFFWRNRAELQKGSQATLIEKWKAELLRLNKSNETRYNQIQRAWPKLKKFYEQTAQASKFVDGMRRDMGLKVFDEVANEYRDSIGSSISTTMRKPSRDLNRVYRILKDNWDLGENEDKATKTLLLDENFRNTYVGKRYGDAGRQEEIFTHFIEPILNQSGESILPATTEDGLFAPRQVVQETLRESGADIQKFSELLAEKLGQDPAEYTAAVLLTFDTFYRRIRSTQVQNSTSVGLTGTPTPHVMMDARQFNDWPAEWVEYADFTERDMYQYGKHLSINSAFGRNNSLLANYLDKAIAQAESMANIKKEVEQEMVDTAKGLPFTATRKEYEKQYTALAKEAGFGYQSIKNAEKNLRTLKRTKSNMNAWMTKEQGTPPEFGAFNDLIRTLTGHIVQSPGTALVDTISIVEQPFKKFGLTSAAALMAAQNIKTFGALSAGTFMQAFGYRLNFATDDLKLMEELGLSDEVALIEGGFFKRIQDQWRSNMADEYVSDSKAGAAAEWAARALRVPLELSVGKTGEAGSGIFPALRPQAIFSQLSTTAASANTLSTWKTYRNLVANVADAMERSPELMSLYKANGLLFTDKVLDGKTNPSLESVVEGLGYGRKYGIFNNKQSFDYMYEALQRNGIKIEDLALDYIQRRNADAKADPIQDKNVYRALAHMTQSEVMMETALTTRTPELLSNGVLYSASPLVGWSLAKFVDVAKTMRNEKLELDRKILADGLMTYAAVLPIALFYAYLRDEYDEEVLGKKGPLQRGQGLLGAPSMEEIGQDPMNALQIAMERLDRVGTFGLGGEVFSSLVNFESGREFSVDSRVYALNTLRTLKDSVSRLMLQRTATYQSVTRPLVSSFGGSGYLQWAQIFNNALGLDNIESRVARRISVGNYLRAAGKANDLDVRTFRGAMSVPNQIKPHIGEMVLAAMADDMVAFEAAYKDAYNGALAEGKEEPARTIKQSFQAYHPLKIVFKSPPTEAEYQDLLLELSSEGKSQVEDAINKFNQYGSKLEIKPYYGKQDKKKKGVSRYIRMPSTQPPVPRVLQRDNAVRAAFDITTP